MRSAGEIPAAVLFWHDFSADKQAQAVLLRQNEDLMRQVSERTFSLQEFMCYVNEGEKLNIHLSRARTVAVFQYAFPRSDGICNSWRWRATPYKLVLLCR
jgi:hypothetical protein